MLPTRGAPVRGTVSRPHSVAAVQRAEAVIARGVASSARLRTATTPLVAAHADGAVITDVDGREYIDFALGLGPVILGHRPPEVLAAVADALESGIVYAAPHEREAELAELAVAAIPSAERVAFACTGSEAVHLAVRTARSRTGRRRVIKFDGHYHGWTDPLFVNTPMMPAISGMVSAPSHAVSGEPSDDDVTVAVWNDLGALEAALSHGPPAAAVIMEPVSCNFGTVEPEPSYMAGARRLCDEHGCLLIFDEVLTGFRLALGGAQERLRTLPDLTVCSKAIASGFPIALLVGTAEAMWPLTDGPVRVAGTFNGSPPSVAAAIATIAVLSSGRDVIYPRFEMLGAELAAGIREAAAAAAAPLVVNQVGSVLQLFWGVPEPVLTYADAIADDRAAIAGLTARLMDLGVHVPERGLILLSAAHTREQVAAAVDAFARALDE